MAHMRSTKVSWEAPCGLLAIDTWRLTHFGLFSRPNPIVAWAIIVFKLSGVRLDPLETSAICVSQIDLSLDKARPLVWAVNSLHVPFVFASRFMSVMACLSNARNFKKCSRDPWEKTGMCTSWVDSSDLVMVRFTFFLHGYEPVIASSVGERIREGDFMLWWCEAWRLLWWKFDEGIEVVLPKKVLPTEVCCELLRFPSGCAKLMALS